MSEEYPRTVKDLEKEYPKTEFFYIEREKPLTKFFASVHRGDFEVWEGSPSHRGEKRPLYYYKEGD